MLRDRHDDLITRYGVELSVVGIAELGGAALDVKGLDLEMIVDALAAKTPLAELPGVGRAGMSALELLRACAADVLLGATPVDLKASQPGLDLARAALASGTHVVLADKGPVALAYDELVSASDLADGWGVRHTAGREDRPGLRFSATVAGALPVINLGRRDLAGEEITRIEGVFNGTSQYILRGMEAGDDFAEALADTQRRGIAEADPSLDIDGHDAAFKLLVTANAVLGAGARLDDVAVTGIRTTTPEGVRAEIQAGRRLVPLAVAERHPGGFRLRVGPESVPADHPLARLHPDEMGVVFYAGRVQRLSAASLEPHPDPASAAMLRDVLDIVRTRPRTGARPGTVVPRLTLRRLPGELAMLRLGPADDIPPWALTSPTTFSSISRTGNELSLIVPAAVVPAGTDADRGWFALGIGGQFDLDQPGIANSVLAPLAAAGQSVFVVATFDTDYFIVRDPAAATAVLEKAGHRVEH